MVVRMIRTIILALLFGIAGNPAIAQSGTVGPLTGLSTVSVVSTSLSKANEAACHTTSEAMRQEVESMLTASPQLKSAAKGQAVLIIKPSVWAIDKTPMCAYHITIEINTLRPIMGFASNPVVGYLTLMQINSTGTAVATETDMRVRGAVLNAMIQLIGEHARQNP